LCRRRTWGEEDREKKNSQYLFGQGREKRDEWGYLAGSDHEKTRSQTGKQKKGKARGPNSFFSSPRGGEGKGPGKVRTSLRGVKRKGEGDRGHIHLYPIREKREKRKKEKTK